MKSSIRDIVQDLLSKDEKICKTKFLYSLVKLFVNHLLLRLMRMSLGNKNSKIICSLSKRSPKFRGVRKMRTRSMTHLKVAEVKNSDIPEEVSSLAIEEKIKKIVNQNISMVETHYE